jgi:6-phosphogluconolactonase
LVANYGGGSASVLPIQVDGKLGPPTATVQHKGKSTNPQRQQAPHAHSINLDAANRHAFVADLGLDKVLVYKFDPMKGRLTGHEPPYLNVAPGAGPRHFAFHPNGKNAYVINELNSTVSALAYDENRGVLSEIQTVATLPADFKGVNHTAEVLVHPSGAFVYGSNRGHDRIAIFAVDPTTGKLTPAGHQAKGIKTPRNFNVDPTGKWLLVANQDGGSVIVFQIDPKTGALTPTDQRIEVSRPVCVKMMPAGR